jgi:hypothetical protein
MMILARSAWLGGRDERSFTGSSVVRRFSRFMTAPHPALFFPFVIGASSHAPT